VRVRWRRVGEGEGAVVGEWGGALMAEWRRWTGAGSQGGGARDGEIVFVFFFSFSFPFLFKSFSNQIQIQIFFMFSNSNFNTNLLNYFKIFRKPFKPLFIY
jgi:hypothetical protein